MILPIFGASSWSMPRFRQSPDRIRRLITTALTTVVIAGAAEPIDPLVQASAYADKTVWSYHDSKPVPWSIFRPKDYGSSQIAFSGTGVRSVGRVPAPGVHPRMFFSPEDLPALRKRLKEDRAGQEAWKNILAWSHALKLTYDEKADYAQPDWANGGFGIHGRFVDLMRIGGYGSKREDFLAVLAAGGKPKIYEKNSPASFFKPAATEAFRCLIDDDAEGAKTLAKATITAIKLEQERRAQADKPTREGEPPRPSTGRADACGLGYIYDFIFNYLTPEQQQIMHDELVLLSAWSDNYGTFNNAEASRSNWATFAYWVFDLMAIEGEPGFNDLKFLGLYRGWRNFFTYSFFDSGAAYEAEGKLLFGLDAVVAFDRVGYKYGLEPLTQHPLPRSYYGKFSAYSMLPTRDAFTVFDILGSVSKERSSGFTTPHDLVVAKYLYPNDKTTDFVYRAMIGDDYRTLPASLHFHWHHAITSAIFATAYDPDNTPEKLNLPLTFFCGQRAVMMTRSSWDRNATFLTMHVRGASGGHPYPDRNGIMLTAQGRPWVTIPGKDIGGWACNTVIIDEANQSPTTPGRVVDYVDEPKATFMTGDAKYCWDWVWTGAATNKQGQPCSRDDVLKDNVETGAGWKMVNQCFNDFAWTKSEREIYKKPLKFNASWIAKDGVFDARIRQSSTPVLKAFRTAGIVRGARPYVLVIDDAQRDAMPARYDWNLTLMDDVVAVKPSKGLGVEGDIIMTGKASISTGGTANAGDILSGKTVANTDGTITAGEPALLIRVLACAGTRLPTEFGLHDKHNHLSIRTRAPAPDFKILMYAFRMGDPLPKTTWSANHSSVVIEFPGQQDTITFTPAASGKTDVVVSRDGAALAKIIKPVEKLADPDSDLLTERLNQIPARLATLRQQNYVPQKQPGWVAGWNFNQIQKGAFVPLSGSLPTALPIPSGEAKLVDGLNGQQAVAVTKAGLQVSLDFAKELDGPFTLATWVKTKSGSFMGGVLESNSHQGVGLDIVQGSLRFSTLKGWGQGGSNSTSMLSSWTHLAVTGDAQTVNLYRNGYLLVSIPKQDRKVAWAKQLKLGVGDAECTFDSIYFYKTAFTPAAIESLYLWGKYGARPEHPSEGSIR